MEAELAVDKRVPGRAPRLPWVPADGGTRHPSLRGAPTSSRPQPRGGGASRGEPALARRSEPRLQPGARPRGAEEGGHAPPPSRPANGRPGRALCVPPPPGKLGAGEKFVQRLEGRERSSEPGSQEEEDERSQVRASGRVDFKQPSGRRKQPPWQPPASIAARAAQG